MDNINWEFIAQLEGGNRLQGYVPDRRNSNSGITIAAGFDLGCRCRNDLNGLPPHLINQLAHYTGKQGAQAAYYLRQYPLHITVADAECINKLAKQTAVRYLRHRYNEDSPHKFEELPEPLATIIASVAFQYGHLGKKAPKFWGHAIKKDITALINELENFGDNYPTRRQKEAAHLIQLEPI